MNRKMQWRPIYVLFVLLGLLLLLVGQWGAGVTVIVLTVALSQLVRIVAALELMASALQEPASETAVTTGGSR